MDLNLAYRLLIMCEHAFLHPILCLQAAYEAPALRHKPKVLSVKYGLVIFKFDLGNWSVKTRLNCAFIDQFAYVECFGFLESSDGGRIVLLSVLTYKSVSKDAFEVLNPLLARRSFRLLFIMIFDRNFRGILEVRDDIFWQRRRDRRPQRIHHVR